MASPGRQGRYRGFVAVLLSLAAESWAQTNPNVQSQAAADVAMAESAGVAMASVTGAPIGAGAPVAAAHEPSHLLTTTPALAHEPSHLLTSTPYTHEISHLVTSTPVVGAAFRHEENAAFRHEASHLVTSTPYPVPAVGVASATTPGVQDCQVLAGTTGKLMQVLLFVCSCAALVFKYRRESGDRTPGEFVMDSSKQLIGAGWIHVLNLSFAKGLEAHYKAGDQCQWYWLNIVLDCTLGVAVEYVLMLFLSSCIRKMNSKHSEDLETGDYRRQDGSCVPSKYVKQLLMWLLIVSLMKLSMCSIMGLGHESLVAVAQAMLSPFANDATLKLFVVMIFTPVLMNVFQFWMVDNFIKRQSKGENDMSTGDMELDGSMRTRIQHGDL